MFGINRAIKESFDRVTLRDLMRGEMPLVHSERGEAVLRA
jgi:hypothetical protein